MRPSKTLGSIDEFVKWIENPELKICTDENEPAQQYFTTLHKGIQDMFAIDRFYAVPNTVPADWKLMGVRLDTVEVYFEYVDAQNNPHSIAYVTRKSVEDDLKYCLNTKESKGKKYYIYSGYISWVEDGYEYCVLNCTEGKSLFTADTDVAKVIEGVSFKRVDLPPLKK